MAFALYGLLLMPVASILVVKNIPEMVRSGQIPVTFSEAKELAEINMKIDTIINEGDTTYLQKVDEEALQDTMKCVISAKNNNGNLHVGLDLSEAHDEMTSGNSNPFGIIMRNVILLSFIIGFLFNLPFKIFINRKRKGKEIKPWIYSYCRKLLTKTPIINAGILFISYLVVLIFLHFSHLANPAESNINEGFAGKFYLISVISSVLTVVFVYNWLKHRVQFKYIEHFFTQKELLKSIYRKQSGKMVKKMISLTLVTTFLPLLIVIFYMTMSVTTLSGLRIDEVAAEHLYILYGPYFDAWGDASTMNVLGDHNQMGYVNAIDTILMFIGIFAGIINSLIYIIFFVKWNTYSIAKPVKELLAIMDRTGKTGEYAFSLVRTNDEMGSLTQGFNEMSDRIGSYIHEIQDMNQNLEEMVSDRTKMVEKQKEEIESQRDSILEQKNEIEAQRDEIEAQRNMAVDQMNRIADQKQEITDSIIYAQRIQHAILPGKEVISECYSDYFIYFRPRDLVSGDFFWASKKNNKLILAAVDCTGHGVPGAMMSMLGIAFLNEIVNANKMTDPGKILDRLRSLIISSLHHSNNNIETKDGMDIALAVIDFDKSDKEYTDIRFSGAHNPLYILTGVSENEIESVPVIDGNSSQPVDSSYLESGIAITEIKADRMPIGIYSDDMAKFSTRYLKVKSESKIYLFSDGYADQFGEKTRKKLKYKGFRKILVDIFDYPMKEQESFLDNAHLKWKGNIEQIDDMVIIGIDLSKVR